MTKTTTTLIMLTNLHTYSFYTRIQNNKNSSRQAGSSTNKPIPIYTIHAHRHANTHRHTHAKHIGTQTSIDSHTSAQTMNEVSIYFTVMLSSCIWVTKKFFFHSLKILTPNNKHAFVAPKNWYYFCFHQFIHMKDNPRCPLRACDCN